jgi:phosphoglycolate phosphatase
MEHFEIMNYFKVLIGRENVKNPKPHPEPILKALQQLNYKNEKVYMIGDTCLDVISAKEANVTPIAVYSGYATKEELEHCSKIVVENALKAIELIN